MVNMGNVWDRTTGFIADNSRAILSIAVPGLLLPLAASRVVSGAMQDCGNAINPLTGGILSVVLMVPVLWSVLALTALVVSSGGAAEAGRAALSSLGRAIAAIVLIVAALIVVLLPLMLARSGSGPSFTVNTCAASAASAAQGNAPVWVPVYGVVWLIMAVFIAARLTMLYPVVVVEGGVVGALRRAWQLSRGIVWKLIGVTILFQVVKAIAELAALLVLGSIGKMLAPEAGPFGASTIVVAILVACVGVAFWVIVATFTALLYRDVTGQGLRPAA
ncbi:MAG: hypothetical protein ABIR08_05585 [Sphingomonas sp.]